MYEIILREAGLGQNESKVYEALLHINEASIQELAVKSKVHRRNVYDALTKLVEKGLASQTFMREEKHYRAANPRRILELLKEKETIIETALPQMQRMYDSLEEKEEAYIYHGVEGYKTYMNDILKTKETCYFTSAKGYWFDERLKNYLPGFLREAKRLGIKYKHLFDWRVRSRKDILATVGKPYKFLPKKYSTPFAIDIFGDYVVGYTGVDVGRLPEDPIQFVLKSKKLADGYRMFFDYMWDMCPE